jgi:hypothetical protein
MICRHEANKFQVGKLPTQVPLSLLCYSTSVRHLAEVDPMKHGWLGKYISSYFKTVSYSKHLCHPTFCKDDKNVLKDTFPLDRAPNHSMLQVHYNVQSNEVLTRYEPHFLEAIVYTWKMQRNSMVITESIIKMQYDSTLWSKKREREKNRWPGGPPMIS